MYQKWYIGRSSVNVQVSFQYLRAGLTKASHPKNNNNNKNKTKTKQPELNGC